MNRRNFIGFLAGIVGASVIGIPIIQKREERIFVPMFEIMSTPTISFEELRTRRFDSSLNGIFNKKRRGCVIFSNKIENNKTFSSRDYFVIENI